MNTTKKNIVKLALLLTFSSLALIGQTTVVSGGTTWSQPYAFTFHQGPAATNLSGQIAFNQYSSAPGAGYTAASCVAGNPTVCILSASPNATQSQPGTLLLLTGFAGGSWAGLNCVYCGTAVTSVSGQTLTINFDSSAYGTYTPSSGNVVFAQPTAMLYSSGTVTQIPGLSPSSFATGINSSGHVVGVSNGRGFFYNGSTITDLGITRPMAISNSDVVVGCLITGSYTAEPNPTPINHAFQWVAGVTTDILGTGGGSYSCATAIDNTLGTIAGVFTASGGGIHAFTWNGTSMTDIGGTAVYGVRGINDGVVIGCDGQRGFYFNGTWNLIPLLSGDTSNCATGINFVGDVVGWSYAPGSVPHPWYFNTGTSTLTALGLAGSLPSGPWQPLVNGVIPWAWNGGTFVGVTQ
jgi:hypothetical protein